MPANRVSSRNPWHLVLVLDDSGSMSAMSANSQSAAEDVNQAIRTMIAELKVLSMGVKPYFRLSIIQFGSRTQIVCEAENEQDVDENRVACLAGQSGTTDARAALEDTAALLRRNPGVATDFTPYVFFLSDGYPDDREAAITAAEEVKSLNITAGRPRIVALGFGEVDDEFMSRVASSPELYRRLASSRDVVSFFPNIGTVAQTSVGTEAVEQAIMNL